MLHLCNIVNNLLYDSGGAFSDYGVESGNYYYVIYIVYISWFYIFTTTT